MIPRNRLQIAVCLILIITAAGCRHRASGPPGVTVRWAVQPARPHVGVATVLVSLTDHGNPVTGALVKLEGDMAHAGMQPVFATAAETVPGTYSAPLQFTMAGDWIVSVDARLPGGQSVQREFPIKDVESK